MIKLGVLCPYSSIYPNMHNDFLNGMKMAIPKDYQDHYEIHEEFISSGLENQVRTALEKLLFFKRVDIVTGFCNYKILDLMLDMMKNFNTVAFMADMGEIIPKEDIISEKIFFNSLSLWQSEYALGAYAQGQYGANGKGLIVMSDYEAGYHFHSAFMKGVASVEETEVELAIIPQHRASKELMIEYFNEYVKLIKKQRPSYVYALFAGQEAIDFMDIYGNSSIAKDIPLLVSSHMASKEILQNLNVPYLDIYSANVWDEARQNKENELFVKLFFQQFGEMPNTFNLLGYEIGLAMRELDHVIRKKDWIKMNQLLKQAQLRTPRGEKLFGWSDSDQVKNISVEKILVGDKALKRIEFDKQPVISWNSSTIQSIITENVSGYLNPYLCI